MTAPIEVVEQELVAHGVAATGAKLFLLGYLIGREWEEQRLGDEERLREWLRRYFAGTGRRRRKRPDG